MKIKPSLTGLIALLFTDAGKSCPSLVFLSFNTICENKIETLETFPIYNSIILYLTEVHNVHRFFQKYTLL